MLFSFRDPHGDWGVQPKSSQWKDSNATFSGVSGEVVSGNADMSTVFWEYNLDRANWLDYSEPLMSSKLLIVTNGLNTEGDKVDHTFFMR